MQSHKVIKPAAQHGFWRHAHFLHIHLSVWRGDVRGCVHTHTHTRTHRERDTHTPRHTRTLRHAQRETHTCAHTHTHTHTETHKHRERHTNSRTHTNTLARMLGLCRKFSDAVMMMISGQSVISRVHRSLEAQKASRGTEMFTFFQISVPEETLNYSDSKGTCLCTFPPISTRLAIRCKHDPKTLDLGHQQHIRKVNNDRKAFWAELTLISLGYTDILFVSKHVKVRSHQTNEANKSLYSHVVGRLNILSLLLKIHYTTDVNSRHGRGFWRQLQSRCKMYSCFCKSMK